MRHVAFISVLCLSTIMADAAPLLSVPVLPAIDLRGRLSSPHAFSAACCKICRKGRACGNSCISAAKTCRKPPGCACDG